MDQTPEVRGRQERSIRELSRRAFLAAAGAGTAGVLLSSTVGRIPVASAAPFRVPLEDVPHKRTWMAWPSSWNIWGNWLDGVQTDVALVARTIARYEPVVMCATSDAAASAARRKCGASVTVISSIPVNDCWMRDSGPVFRRSRDGSRDAIGTNFNGWGGKQIATKDDDVARRVASRARVSFRQARFVGEGGAIESDGHGTVMATESSLVNANRNPGTTKAQIEAAVLAAYGASKMIWVPGIKGKDITDDHIDATSRFVRPGVVMVQVPPAWRRDIWADDARQQLDILSRAIDAKGRRLQVIEMAGPDTVRPNSPDFLDSYVNFALTNGAVITAQFGDAAKDAACRDVLETAFPGRVVEPLNLDRLHLGGGGVHCITQQEPAR